MKLRYTLVVMAITLLILAAGCAREEQAIESGGESPGPVVEETVDQFPGQPLTSYSEATVDLQPQAPSSPEHDPVEAALASVAAEFPETYFTIWSEQQLGDLRFMIPSYLSSTADDALEFVTEFSDLGVLVQAWGIASGVDYPYENEELVMGAMWLSDRFDFFDLDAIRESYETCFDYDVAGANKALACESSSDIHVTALWVVSDHGMGVAIVFSDATDPAANPQLQIDRVSFLVSTRVVSEN